MKPGEGQTREARRRARSNRPGVTPSLPDSPAIRTVHGVSETSSDARHQGQYDDAMFDYSTGAFDAALGKLLGILAVDPNHFDARLALAMCHYRMGDFAAAIAEGHKAERLRPNEQLVHTNLSLFYMKSGDKTTAESHGLKARVALWGIARPTPRRCPRERPRAPTRPAQAQGLQAPRKVSRHALEEAAQGGHPTPEPHPLTRPPEG